MESLWNNIKNTYTRSVSSRRAAIASANSDSACNNRNLLGSILLKILVYKSMALTHIQRAEHIRDTLATSSGINLVLSIYLLIRLHICSGTLSLSKSRSLWINWGSPRSYKNIISIQMNWFNYLAFHRVPISHRKSSFIPFLVHKLHCFASVS